MPHLEHNLPWALPCNSVRRGSSIKRTGQVHSVHCPKLQISQPVWLSCTRKTDEFYSRGERAGNRFSIDLLGYRCSLTEKVQFKGNSRFFCRDLLISIKRY